jgi:MoaA/NifB/PqqE/SkfB family radical SAM enzyme
MRMRFGPSGIHLFNRDSGLNILFDEFIPPEGCWAKAPRYLAFALTNACDLRCPYCYAPKTRAALAFERVVEWLNEVDANGAMGVGFGGGEPTLYPRFPQLCAYASRYTGLAVTFTTHGHHLSEAYLDALKGNVHFVRISMDGIGSTYERLRGRSFATLQQQITSIRRISQFGINYVVNAQTLPDLDAATALAEAAGATEFLLLPEQPVNGRDRMSDATAAELRAWVRRHSGQMRLSVSEVGSDDMPTCNAFKDERGLWGYVHVDAHGVLKRRSFDRTGVAIERDGLIAALSKLRHFAEDRP